MHQTQNDISSANRKKLCDLIQASVADCFDLLSQAKQAHWNVRGPNFIALHELFDQVHAALEPHLDVMAERIAQLGGQVHGTVRAAAKATSLKEYPLDISDGQEHVKALSAAIASFGKTARENIDAADKLGDMDAADIFTALSRDLDKYLWFVESHMEGAGVEAKPAAKRAAS
jgi:starvation-inducible DNA-binding protein